MVITLNPKRITQFFAWPVLFLATAHIVGQLLRYSPGAGDNILIEAFNLDVEKNIPSLYVLVEWLFCLALLSVITFVKKKQKSPYAPWMGIVILFGFLSFDEFMSIHESISWHIHLAFKTSGALFYPWIIPYSILIVILGIVSLKFMMNLPAMTRNLFIFAFVVFTASAIGIELFEGLHLSTHGKDNVYYLVFVTIEESLEMAGLVIFIYALSSYLTNELGIAMFRIGRSNTDVAS